MPATLRHFAINADEAPRAKRFYEQVFGWTFTPWGPPGFYQTRTTGEDHLGALQGRREGLMAPFDIETVGRLLFFQDTEGNVAGAMQYEAVEWPA